MDIMRLRRDAMLGQLGGGGYEPMDIMGGGYEQSPESTGISPAGDYYPTPSSQPPTMWQAPPPVPTVPTYQQPQMEAPPKDYFGEQMRMVNDQYRPETEATNRFNALLEDFPERNSPSWARKLVAGGMGLKSQNPLETMEGVLHAPYIRDVGAWKEQAGPMYNAANLERQSNVNERQLLGQMSTGAIAQQRADELQRHNRANEEVQQVRAQAYAYKQYHPDWKFDFSGPIVMAINPGTGKLESTGIPSGKLSQADQILMNSDRDVRRVEAQGAQAQALENARQPNRLELIDRRAEYGMGTGGGNSETNLRTARNNFLQQKLDENPEAYKDIIIPPTTANGQYRIVPPTRGMMGFEGAASYANRRQPYDDLQAELNQFYSSTTGRRPTGTRTQSGAAPAAPAAAAPASPTGSQPIGGNNRPPKPMGIVGAGSRPTVEGPDIVGGIKSGAQAAWEGRKGPAEAPRMGNLTGPTQVEGMDMSKITPQQRKAIVFLESNGLPVDKANIDHAIKTGRVQ